jgi:hypothetical protein
MDMVGRSGLRSVRRTAPVLAALLALAGLGALPAQDWSGTITVIESLVGPAGVGGSDRTELDEYAKLLKERLQKAQQELHTVPPVVALALREDIGAYQAELERVVLERGDAIKVGTSVFTIKGERMLISGDGPRLLIDRAANQETLYVGGKREVVPLAPLPAPAELDKSAPEATVLGLQARRLTMRAEGKVCTVLLAPGMPNPYALSLLPAAGGEKDTIPQGLARLPGLPLLVEYKSDVITHRWAVVQLEAKPVPDAFFAE